MQPVSTAGSSIRQPIYQAWELPPPGVGKVHLPRSYPFVRERPDHCSTRLQLGHGVDQTALRLVAPMVVLVFAWAQVRGVGVASDFVSRVRKERKLALSGVAKPQTLGRRLVGGRHGARALHKARGEASEGGGVRGWRGVRRGGRGSLNLTVYFKCNLRSPNAIVESRLAAPPRLWRFRRALLPWPPSVHNSDKRTRPGQPPPGKQPNGLGDNATILMPSPGHFWFTWTRRPRNTSFSPKQKVFRQKGVYLDDDLTPDQQAKRRQQQGNFVAIKTAGYKPFWRLDRLLYNNNGQVIQHFPGQPLPASWSTSPQGHPRSSASGAAQAAAAPRAPATSAGTTGPGGNPFAAAAGCENLPDPPIPPYAMHD